MCTPCTFAQKKLCKYFYFIGEIVGFESFDNFYALQTDSDVVKLEQEKLRNEMQNFYASDTNSGMVMVRVGCNAAVLLEGFWRRCVVTKMLQDRDVEVFAVDLGLYIVVAQEQLRLLNVQFLKTAQATIRCCLADIVPKDVDLGYSKKAIKAFKKMTMNTERTVKIEVMRVPNDDQAPIPVLIYVLLGAEKKVIVNAMLAEKFDCVISTGHERIEMIVGCDEDELPVKPIVKRAKKIVIVETQKRMEVEILHIVDPSEFYVIPKHRIEDIKKLSESIKQYMTMNEDPGSMKVGAKDLIRGNLCLAKQADKNGNIEWHRAKVVSIVDDDPQTFNVLLIDKGFSIFVKPSDVFEIPERALRKPAGAIKMHMAGARSTTGGQWSCSSIDQFKELSQRFESYYVSIVGDKDDGASFPVVVWGITTEEIKIVTQKQFHNLTAYLSYYGFIDCYEKIESEDVVKVERSVTDEMFGWMSNNPSNSQEHRMVFEEVTESEEKLATGLTMSLVPRTLNSWIPAEMISSGKFTGLVTNVDEDGNISIQKKRQTAVMKEMTDKLTSYYSTLPSESYLLILKGGQSIIIFKELDAKFYRGRVEALPTKYEEYKITLVDYGTVEYVKKENIFTNVIAANVPLQSQHFRLASVVPLEKCGNEWPKETLKFLDDELVDCDVRVNVTLPGDVSECLIYVLDEASGKFVDIQQLLTSKNLAAARQADSSWPPMKKTPPKKFHKFDAMDPKKLRELDELEMSLRITERFAQPKTFDVAVTKTRDFLHRIKEDFNDEIVRLVMLLKSQPHSKIHRRSKQAPFDSSHKWLRRPHRMATIPTEYDFEKIFLRKKRVLEAGRKHVGTKSPANIFFFDIQAAEIDEFPCYFVSILGYKKIYVKPMIEELNVKSRELDQFMKTFDSQLLVKFGDYEMVARKLCVVDIGSILMRGRIISADGIDALEVFLIDIAEVRLFSMNNVFKMPMKFRNFPCQILMVMLKGISIGPKAWSENDIVQRLPKLLNGHLMTAIVRGHDNKDYPQVDLLIDEKCVLQPAIDENLCIFKEDEDKDSLTM